MQLVLLTALGIGGATVIGAIIGFLFKRMSHSFSDIILAFAAGVMLAASVLGLILPSLEYGNVFVTIIGIFTGAILLNLIDKVVPHLHNIAAGGAREENHPANTERINKILLFVLAIAIHNFPEGIAAGVGFGTGDMNGAFMIALSIALQNIPEGMIIIAPMLSAGISPGRTFLYASVTGLIEVVGTLVGYFAVSLSTAILPFALAFAGGTMLYVISDEMIPETHHGDGRFVTYSLLSGFCLILVTNFYLG